MNNVIHPSNNHFTTLYKVNKHKNIPRSEMPTKCEYFGGKIHEYTDKHLPSTFVQFYDKYVDCTLQKVYQIQACYCLDTPIKIKETVYCTMLTYLQHDIYRK